MLEVIATFSAGTFFGASVYINLAQHPATLQAGSEFAARFFPPMYAKASVLQITLALIGSILGGISWFNSNEVLWLVGALFLVSVIPITLIFIKPINDKLLDTANPPASSEVTELLSKWNPRHWVRSAVSCVAFVCFILAIAN